MMFTHSQYMAGECTHETFYGQFVTPLSMKLVRDGIGERAIKTSIDPHFNDIPLVKWDVAAECYKHSNGARMLNEYGGSLSLGTLVCIMKATARAIKCA
jgi:hypothetical protein